MGPDEPRPSPAQHFSETSESPLCQGCSEIVRWWHKPWVTASPPVDPNLQGAIFRQACNSFETLTNARVPKPTSKHPIHPSSPLGHPPSWSETKRLNQILGCCRTVRLQFWIGLSVLCFGPKTKVNLTANKDTSQGQRSSHLAISSMDLELRPLSDHLTHTW